jgi:hypothetical protein
LNADIPRQTWEFEKRPSAGFERFARPLAGYRSDKPLTDRHQSDILRSFFASDAMRLSTASHRRHARCENAADAVL